MNEEETRDSLTAIGCPPDIAAHIAAHIAGMDRREDEIRERLLRMAEITGPVEIRKVTE